MMLGNQEMTDFTVGVLRMFRHVYGDMHVGMKLRVSLLCNDTTKRIPRSDIPEILAAAFALGALDNNPLVDQVSVAATINSSTPRFQAGSRFVFDMHTRERESAKKLIKILERYSAPLLAKWIKEIMFSDDVTSSQRRCIVEVVVLPDYPLPVHDEEGGIHTETNPHPDPGGELSGIAYPELDRSSEGFGRIRATERENCSIGGSEPTRDV